jgi:glycosyltransferase involved in cell wall biosynthesis
VRVSVVVPVKDGAALLERTLPALAAALPEATELIVSDDGGRDASAEVARRCGAIVIRSDRSLGPAAARNRGAAGATGEVLVFLDADVRVNARTLGSLLAPLAEPGIAAAFGSYDASPEARSWVSLYRNLAHHFVHQRSAGEAETFWAGCGAVRAGVFRALGGFDERYTRPSIEDVELGYRLVSAGHRIRLVPQAQVTHLKRWTLASFLVTDVRDRALPWARLARDGRGLPRGLNFTRADRLASASVGSGLAAAGLSPVLGPWALAAGALAFVLAVALDAPLLGFAARSVSPGFAAAAAGLQLLHRAAGVLGLAIGLLGPGLPPRRRSS